MPVSYPAALVKPNATRGDVKNAVPVTGRTLVGCTNALNHFAGWRRPWHVYVPSIQPPALYAASDFGWPLNTGTRAEVHKVLITTSTLSSHLELIFHVASYAEGGTVDPYVRVNLSTQTGTVIDEGVQWRRSDGTLPGGDELPRVRAAGNNYYRSKPTVISTGGLARDGLVAIPYGPPRMLYFDNATYGGATLVLDIQAGGAWITSLTVFEYPEVTL